MQFQILTDDDWQIFISWADAEGWKIPFQEQRLLQNQLRPCFFALKHRGRRCGYVSAVAYKNSGWIGNLLVDPQLRGKGYGSALFNFALDFLQKIQPERIWLTASLQGAPLYRKHGFMTVDRVERWTAHGRGELQLSACDQLSELIELDRRCWNESRAPLLALLADDAGVIGNGRTLAMLQGGVAFWQLGPWLSAGRCPRENRLLLTQSLKETPEHKILVADVLSSAEAEWHLRNAGFTRQGTNDLMCRSQQPVQTNGVIALASLGSIG